MEDQKCIKVFQNTANAIFSGGRKDLVLQKFETVNL